MSPLFSIIFLQLLCSSVFFRRVVSTPLPGYTPSVGEVVWIAPSDTQNSSPITGGSGDGNHPHIVVDHLHAQEWHVAPISHTTSHHFNPSMPANGVHPGVDNLSKVYLGPTTASEDVMHPYKQAFRGARVSAAHLDQIRQGRHGTVHDLGSDAHHTAAQSHEQAHQAHSAAARSHWNYAFLPDHKPGVREAHVLAAVHHHDEARVQLAESHRHQAKANLIGATHTPNLPINHVLHSALKAQQATENTHHELKHTAAVSKHLQAATLHHSAAHAVTDHRLKSEWHTRLSEKHGEYSLAHSRLEPGEHNFITNKVMRKSLGYAGHSSGPKAKPRNSPRKLGATRSSSPKHRGRSRASSPTQHRIRSRGPSKGGRNPPSARTRSRSPTPGPSRGREGRSSPAPDRGRSRARTPGPSKGTKRRSSPAHTRARSSTPGPSRGRGGRSSPAGRSRSQSPKPGHSRGSKRKSSPAPARGRSQSSSRGRPFAAPARGRSPTPGPSRGRGRKSSPAPARGRSRSPSRKLSAAPARGRSPTPNPSRGSGGKSSPAPARGRSPTRGPSPKAAKHSPPPRAAKPNAPKPAQVRSASPKPASKAKGHR